MKKSTKITVGAVSAVILIGGIASIANSNKATVNKGDVSTITNSPAESSVSENQPESVIEESQTEKAVAALGDSVSTKDFKIAITKAYTTKSIQNKDSEYLNTEADDGKVYLILEINAENISDKKQNISSYYFNTSVDDYAVDEKYLINKPNGLEYLSGDVMAGKKTNGYLAYEIDENWKNCEVAYTEIFSSTPSFTFVFTSDDVEKQ